MLNRLNDQEFFILCEKKTQCLLQKNFVKLNYTVYDAVLYNILSEWELIMKWAIGYYT